MHPVSHIICARAATAAVLIVMTCLLAWVFQYSVPSEKPYEEGAFVSALASDNAALLSNDCPWSEHPPLPYAIYAVISPASSGRASVQILRIVSGVFFVVAFVGLLYWLTRYAPSENRNPGSNGETPQAANSVASSRVRDRSAVPYVGAAFFNLAVFSSPLVLAHSCRVSSESISYAAFVALLIAGLQFLRRGGRVRVGAFVGAALLLTWSTCYGLIAALSFMLATSFVAWVSLERSPSAVASTHGDAVAQQPHKTRQAALLLGAMALVGASAMFPGFQLTERWSLLVDHYWSVGVISYPALIPYSFLWNAASSGITAARATWLSDGLSICLAILVIGVVLGRRASVGTLVVGIGFLLFGGALAGAAWVWGANVAVPHLLGIQQIWLFVLLWCATIDACGAGWEGAKLILGVLALSVVGIPNVCGLLSSDCSGDEVVRVAAAYVSERATNVDAVVFGGSRSYFLFQRHLTVDVDRKSRIYLRDGLRPDNFAAKSLLPSQRVLRASDLPLLHQRSIVYVELEAAQSIRIDTSPWRRESLALYGHPCNAIGDIQVFALAPTAPRAGGGG